MLSIGLYRGRWYLYRDNKRTRASWPTEAEASDFMWRLMDAAEQDGNA